MKLKAIIISSVLVCLPSMANSQSFERFVPKNSMIDDSRFQAILQKLNGITMPDGPENLRGRPAVDPGRLIPPAKDQTTSTPIESARQRTAELADPRIAGGWPATIEDFPWQVALIDGDAPPEIRSPFCGGALIGYRWVLTAAHCLAGVTNANQVDIVAGSTWPKFAGQGDRVKAAKIKIHEEYNNENFENDIAVIQLERPPKKGQIIAIANSELVIPPETSVTVTGWGAVTAYGPMVDRLLKASLPIVANTECNASDVYNGLVKSTMICAGRRQGGLDACQGDSGGPLIAKVSSKDTLVGIVSWGRGCALRLRYGVYTRVSAFTTWIVTQTGLGLATIQ